MFVVVYSFRVKPGREAVFVEAWEKRTGEIASACGGWGSRLHRNEDGGFIAYAQWPDRSTWENFSTGSITSSAGKAMSDALESMSVVYKLDLVRDLLLPIKPQ